MSIEIVDVKKKDFKPLKVIRDNKNKISQIIGGHSSDLVISFKNMDDVIANTLRRVVLDNIPTYAFIPKTIEIEKNTSIFNNDYMRHRLSLLPIFDVPSEIFYLDEQYWKDINYNDPNRPRHPDDKYNLELHVNVHNDTTDILNVTTDHMVTIVNGETVKNKFSKSGPILIIQLKPDQEFICKMSSVLGINNQQESERNKGGIMFSAAVNSYFEVTDDKITHLTLESQGQISEQEILVKACRLIKHKLTLLKNTISDKYNTDKIKKTDELLLEFNNESHTFGNLLNYALQNHKDVIRSGIMKPDQLRNFIIIKLKVKNNNPIEKIFDVIKELNNIFDNLEKKISKVK